MKRLTITRTITDREDGLSIDRYFRDLSYLDASISPEEEKSLAVKIRQGDDIALDKLIKGNLRFVVSVAKQYQHQGMYLSDLISEGNLGLIKAAKRFDETKGFKFISYAVWWIRQSILHALAEQSRIIRLPLNKVGELTKLNKTISMLESNLDREITIWDITDKMEIKMKEGGDKETYIQYLIALSKKHSSLDFSMENNTPSSKGLKDATLLEVLEDKNMKAPDEILIEESISENIMRYLNLLNQQEADVITLFFGLNGDMTLDRIAEKFSISSKRVRQIKDKALRKLRKNTSILKQISN